MSSLLPPARRLPLSHGAFSKPSAATRVHVLSSTLLPRSTVQRPLPTYWSGTTAGRSLSLLRDRRRSCLFSMAAASSDCVGSS